MKTNLLLSLVLACSLTACSDKPFYAPVTMDLALNNPTTKSEHEKLAQYYEETAKDLQLKVEAHKKLLSEFESKANVDSKQAQAFKDHCLALIDAYEKAAAANLGMAKMHHHM